ncbi:hypothetical protein N7536_000572 [Penicillium majusculum]|uniref:Uncharacterized protein n=1 Tax=Penicillium solitum TaxID=60172 RepID=A0A1V6QDT8_9EURO|nr:uncharacterized protein PENSOL_c079G02800 [Penicillium solitum]KAJ5704883.1 hypothetical protein N7536_000572 [Penicillium majusculum]OQD87365.1 hypothetical protein PENSOL_c079G02800 [Penicillium solitum]
MSESAEQLRRMQIIQMADLGTARREMISTADIDNQARTHLAEIESKRLIDQRDEAQLSKWANFHTQIGDTHGMEELDDIDSGQSHRANLHAMLHPDGSQPRTYANHPYPTPSAGRGGGVMGKRGRGGFVPAPPKGPADLPLAFARAAFRGNIGRPGRPGPRARSTTMSASIHLDPALNCNNDDSDSRERGRGCGRGKGKGKGNFQEQAHVPSAPSRAQRQPPAINFATRISDPADFMSSFQSRRATETYNKSTDTTVSAPMQETKSIQQPVLVEEPKPKIPPSDAPKKKAASIAPSSKQTSSPVATLTTPSCAVHIDQPHIGPYLVETPLSARVVPFDKTASFKTCKAQSDTPKSNKTPRVEAPSQPASHSVSAQKGTKSKKGKDMASSSQACYPAVVAIAADEIQWKVSPGEEPRKKDTAPSTKKAVLPKASIPIAEVKNKPVPNVTQPEESRKTVPPSIQTGKTKQKAQIQDLLSEDDSPVDAASPTPRHLKTVAIQSPGAAELAGLKFAEKAGGSVPVKSIDEVIAPKTTINEIDIYGPQIIEELRDIRRHIRSPQDLATTRDIERILESKLLQLVPTAYAPPPVAPAASEIENRLGNLVALVEYLSTSQQATNAVEVPSAARRDLTPFEGHRSPPPPSSSSNSPPSADKHAHKVCVPGLSPTKSESSDIISQFESLQVSDKLAAPLQPQRVVRVPTLRPLNIPKMTTTSDASIQVTPALASRPKEATKKPRTLDDSIFAAPVGSVTSNANVIEPNAVQPQTMTRGLSANHPNIPKQQDIHSTGVRTIGPAPYKPRVIGPAPSPYEPTTLRDVSAAHIRTVSAQLANTENRSSLDVAHGASSSMGQSSGPASLKAPGRLFSMPDPATIPRPKAKATGSSPSNLSRR